MKRYLAVYTGTRAATEERWNKLDEKTRNERMAQGMKAWHAWADKNADITKYDGGPLGKTKRVTVDGVADTSNNLSGFTIIEAETHDDAAKLFLNHPQFTIFPGDGVEIMEIMPIPQM